MSAPVVEIERPEFSFPAVKSHGDQVSMPGNPKLMRMLVVQKVTERPKQQRQLFEVGFGPYLASAYTASNIGPHQLSDRETERFRFESGSLSMPTVRRTKKPAQERFPGWNWFSRVESDAIFIAAPSEFEMIHTKGHQILAYDTQRSRILTGAH